MIKGRVQFFQEQAYILDYLHIHMRNRELLQKQFWLDPMSPCKREFHLRDSRQETLFKDH